MFCRYKQQGEAAVEADNVFHNATYGAVQSRLPASRREQAALEVQINEFGQCPRRIFHAPHPPRLTCPEYPKAGVPELPLTSATCHAHLIAHLVSFVSSADVLL